MLHELEAIETKLVMLLRSIEGDPEQARLKKYLLVAIADVLKAEAALFPEEYPDTPPVNNSFRILTNGATLHARKEIPGKTHLNVVLAHFGENGWVTWTENTSTNPYGYSHGHYFSEDLDRATEDYNRRR